MLLFRSEGHIIEWLAGREPGATTPITKLGELAHACWGDRLSADWRPRTKEQNQAILDGLGLTGPLCRNGAPRHHEADNPPPKA